MVTALGCFGGGFNMDNGFSFRFHANCQTSCLTNSQVCECNRAKRGPEVPVRRERPHGNRDAPCVKGWGRSRPHIVPALVQSDRLWNVYRIKLSSFAGSAPVK